MPVAFLITGYYRGPKLAAAVFEVGPWAEVLWCRALDHCREHDTDGVIGIGVPDTILGRKATKYVASLVKHGAWHPRAEGGHLVHDYHEWNRPAAELAERQQAKSEAKSRAGKAGAAKRWGSRLPKQTDGTAMADGWQSDSPGPGPGPGPGVVVLEEEEVTEVELGREVDDDWLAEHGVMSTSELPETSHNTTDVDGVPVVDGLPPAEVVSIFRRLGAA